MRKTLFFGSKSCGSCEKVWNLLKENNVPYLEFIDGNDFENEEIQNLCDKYEVDDYPHIIVLNIDTDEVLLQSIGALTEQETFNLINQIKVVKIQDAIKSATRESSES